MFLNSLKVITYLSLWHSRPRSLSLSLSLSLPLLSNTSKIILNFICLLFSSFRFHNHKRNTQRVTHNTQTSACLCLSLSLSSSGIENISGELLCFIKNCTTKKIKMPLAHVVIFCSWGTFSILFCLWFVAIFWERLRQDQHVPDWQRESQREGERERERKEIDNETSKILKWERRERERELRWWKWLCVKIKGKKGKENILTGKEKKSDTILSLLSVERVTIDAVGYHQLIL